MYEEVINSMEMRNAPLIKRVNIIRQLMNKSTNLEKKMKYTHRLEEYIKICKEKGIEWLDNENPLYYLEKGIFFISQRGSPIPSAFK